MHLVYLANFFPAVNHVNVSSYFINIAYYKSLRQ